MSDPTTTALAPHPVRRAAALVSATAALAGSLALAAPTAPANAATPVFPASTSARIPTGWAAVETAPTNGHGESLVYAVAPSGAQRLVLHLHATEMVLDVSGDGRRVLTTAYQPTDGVVRIYDLATHRVTVLPQRSLVGSFTNPTGQAVLLRRNVVGAEPVIKVSLTGKLTARYASATSGSFAQTPDGRYLWSSRAGHVTLSNNATGRLVRSYALPKGFGGCEVTHDWDASGVVASCWKGATNQAFLFKLAGGSPVNLTGKLPYSAGYMNAWKTPVGIAANETSDCGPSPTVVKVGSRVRTIPITAVTNVMGTSAYGLTDLSCGDSNPSFVRVDLPGMRMHRLLTPAGGRTIDAVVQNDSREGSIG